METTWESCTILSCSWVAGLCRNGAKVKSFHGMYIINNYINQYGGVWLYCCPTLSRVTTKTPPSWFHLTSRRIHDVRSDAPGLERLRMKRILLLHRVLRTSMPTGQRRQHALQNRNWIWMNTVYQSQSAELRNVLHHLVHRPRLQKFAF